MDKFTVVEMVYLLLPSIPRVNTLTLSFMLTYFLLQKVMFWPFLPNFEFLSPTD